MAQLWTTGPAAIYVGIGKGRAPVFLGHAERAPKIEARMGWEPAINSVGGTSIPHDMSYQGQEAFTIAVLNRFNYDVWSAIKQRPRAAVTDEGSNRAFDVGSLMLTEQLAYVLWVLFPFAVGKPAMNGLVPGYRFPASWLEGPDSIDESGTTPQKVQAIFHSLNVFRVSGYVGSHLLYDHNMAGLPPIN